MANSVGYIPVLLMALGVLFVGIIGGYLWKMAVKITKIHESMLVLEKSLTHEKGDPQVHYGILNQVAVEIRELRQDLEAHVAGAEKHFDVAEALNDSEWWTRCHVDKCPNLTKFQLILQSIQERFGQFESTAAESRATTSHSLDSINVSVQQIGKDIGKELGEFIKLVINLLSNHVGGNRQ